MNAKITQIADSLVVQTMAIGTDLAALSTPKLIDLKHDCQALRLHEDFSMRTAAHMVEANCEIILENRNLS